jgi:hypothetical protein
VGKRAVGIVQVGSTREAGDLKVGDIARVPFSFPTYTGVFGLAGRDGRAPT